MATRRYNPDSVVDYLTSEGKDASFAARKQIAKELGIQGYSGSAAQNTELLTKSKAQKQFGNDALQTPEVAGTVKPSPLLPDGSNYGRGGGIAYGTDDQNRIRRYEGSVTPDKVVKNPAFKQPVEQYNAGEQAFIERQRAEERAKRYASPYENALNSLDNGLPQTLSSNEEEDIRERTRKQFQDQIDAINSVYDGILKQREVVNTNQLGRARATNARGGLIGSDFGNSAMGNVEDQNQDAMANIKAERGAKIAALMGAKNEAAQAAIEKRRSELEKDQEKYLSRKKEVQDEARQYTVDLAKSGMTLEEMTAEQYQKLLDDNGGDELRVKALFNANKPANEQIKYETKIQDGMVVSYGIDPKTGKLDVTSQQIPGLDASKNGKYKTEITPDGTMLLIPENIDPSKPIKDQILMYGTEGQFAKPTKSGGSGTGTTDEITRRAVDAYAAAFGSYPDKADIPWAVNTYKMAGGDKMTLSENPFVKTAEAYKALRAKGKEEDEWSQ